jgi:hypothetical protein
MITYDGNIRQLPYGQRKGLSTAENGITGQEYDRPGELCVTLRFDVPALQACIVIFAGPNLFLPVEGDSLAIAKPVDDGDCSTIVPAGVVTDIDNHAVQVMEVTGNLVQTGSQTPVLNAFQLDDPDVTKCPRSAIVKHPGLGLCGPPETIGDKRLRGRFEELLDLSAREFLPKSGFSFRVEVSLPPTPTCFGYQLDMPVVQRGEHLAENIE